MSTAAGDAAAATTATTATVTATAAARPAWLHHNPYPGLRPFRADETHLFFGRESQVDAMVDRLAAAGFLAVVGSSGCGKSSLVTCGLRPALQRGLMASAGSAWRIASFRPGADPINALAETLARNGVLFDAPPATAAGAAAAVAVPRAALVESTLRLSKRGLIDLVEQARLPSGTKLLLVVDQFEELFRYRALAGADNRAAQDAIGLVNLLLEAATDADGPVYVVLTMRSDFLGDCTQFSGLAEAINAGQYLVPRLTRDERRLAIAGPATVAGAVISPTLLTRLVNDVGDNPDQLSILQHALNRTWYVWALDCRARAAGPADGNGAPADGSGGQDLNSGRPLALPDYEAIGTMAHALDRHAERALAELTDPQHLALAEQVFKALTDRAADPRGVRRPTRYDTLCAITQATPAAVEQVVNVFRKPSRSFLMPPAGEALTPDTVLDISHESLMRVWDRLRRWTDEEAQSAQRYRRLAETATLHADGAAGLWRDPDLQGALDWRAQAKPTAAWGARYAPGFDAAMGFLDRSLADRDAEREADAALAAQAQTDQAARSKAETQATLQKGYAKQMRRRAWLSSGLALMALGMAGLGEYRREQAEVARRDATQALALAKRAESAALASREEALAAKADAEAARFTFTRTALDQDKLLDRAKILDPTLGAALRAEPASPTLFIQIQSEDQRALAAEMQQQAAQQRIKAPGVERVRAGPRVPELRYFRPEDALEAQEAATWLARQTALAGLLTKLVVLPADRIKPRQMELWYGTPPRTWLLVLGSYRDHDNADAQARLLAPAAAATGQALQVVQTRDYPNLREGFFAVVAGPFATEAQAKAQLSSLGGAVKDAYVKSGW